MTQKEKRRVFHLKRLGLFSVLLVAFFIVRFDAGKLPAPLLHAKVLAYATEMSSGGLLSGTNAARAAEGLPGLALNSQLSNSAQMKAEDMAAKDYWAHVAPDGTQPWYFFDQAGYTYIRAGENLAYGFSTSQGAVDGWMNSPSHRANILGDYYDVGFGIVNAPNYQSNGQQTIVVAHYGARNEPAPAPTAPAPAAPAAPAHVAPAETTPSSPSAPAETETAPVDTAPANKPETPITPSSTQSGSIPASVTPVQTGEQARASVLNMLTNRNTPLAALVSLAMVVFVVAGYAITHRSAFLHAVSAGEHFIVRHPGIDTMIVAAFTSLILLTTYGNLQ